MIFWGTVASAMILIMALMPIDAKILVDSGNGFRLTVSIRYVFGLVPIWTFVFGKDDPNKTEKAFLSQLKGWALGTEFKASRSHIVGFLRSFLRISRISDLNFSLRFGFDDPAETGIVCGWLWAFVSMMPPMVQGVVRVEPDFQRKVFECRGLAAVRIIPLFMVILIIIYLFRPATWKTLRMHKRKDDESTSCRHAFDD